MTWYGVVVNGVNYLGGPRTRFGTYPFCESMRATSYSTAKSAFVSIALLRLAQKYSVEVADLLIKDYVPEYAASPGDWERVTFNHALDMSTGNYRSPGFMIDDESQEMGEFFGAQPYQERIKAAFNVPHRAEPGTGWVYRTSDTFILTRAMHNYLQSKHRVNHQAECNASYHRGEHHSDDRSNGHARASSRDSSVTIVTRGLRSIRQEGVRHKRRVRAFSVVVFDPPSDDGERVITILEPVKPDALRLQ